MFNSLIHPGDWWILVLSVVAIDTLSHRKVRWIGAILLIISTVLVADRYNMWRGALHALLVVAFAVGLYHARAWVDKRYKRE